MIKQIVSIVLFLIWFIYSSYGLITPALFIRQEDFMVKIIKNVFQNLVMYMIKYGFEPNIYYNGEIKLEENKVNILISNHIGSIDGFMLLTILKYFNIDNWNVVGKKELIYLPGIGTLFMFGKDIKLERNWELDKITIEKQLNNINDGILIIFPEGTRFEPTKHKEGQQFSIENNLPIYDNLLVPKSKGLMTICNHLKKNNKLGKIIDLSFILPSFLGKSANMNDLLKKEMGNVYLMIRDLNYDNGDFKEWLLNEWKIKDNLITNYRDFIYKKMDYKVNLMILLVSLFFTISVTIKLINNENMRYFMILSIIVTYIITYMTS